MIIKWIIVIIIKVPPIDIIHKSITIIINAIIGCFPRIWPHVWQKIFVIIVNAGINNRNENLDASRVDIPCVCNVYVSIRGTACLSGIIQAI